LSFDRELDYALSYVAGLPVHPLNHKAWLIVTASFSSFYQRPNETALSDTLHSGAIFYYSMCFSFNSVCCWRQDCNAFIR